MVERLLYGSYFEVEGSVLCLQALPAVAEALGNKMAAGLPTMVPGLLSLVGSTNDKLRSAAVLAMDSIIGAVDAVQLVQVRRGT